MKKVKVIFVILLAVILNANAQQSGQVLKEAKQAPKTSEIVVGIITTEIIDGDTDEEYTYQKNTFIYSHTSDNRKHYTEEQQLEKLMDKAKEKYSSTYPNIYLRDFKTTLKRGPKRDCGYHVYQTWTFSVSATVVIPDPKVLANENLSKAIDKALCNVREGSRFAIDNISVPSGTNKEDYKDQVIDVLLDKGYKVVAKEHLEKLYEEQKNQQSGVYNERTTVQENNFSAVGYYINVKVTETSLRVQVINVSTGEYEGNATINF